MQGVSNLSSYRLVADRVACMRHLLVACRARPHDADFRRRLFQGMREIASLGIEDQRAVRLEVFSNGDVSWSIMTDEETAVMKRIWLPRLPVYHVS